MKNIFFPCLTTEVTTGARYAEKLMRKALKQHHRLITFDASAFSVFRKCPSLLAFFGLIPVGFEPFFDLVITSDNYIFCDFLYVQPHAGGDVKFPWLDTMTFKREDHIGTRISLKVMEPIAHITYRRANLVSNSYFTRDLLLKAIERDSSVLYPPVPTHLYEPGTKPRGDEIITLSSLNPRKKLQRIPLLARHLPGHDFGLIGHKVAEHIGILERIRQGFVSVAPTSSFRYYPSLTNGQKAAKLERSKVYFHPTIAEPFGIAVAEAMSAGCIPIVDDSGGVREFVPDEWRYATLEEAAELVRMALAAWTPELAYAMREIADQFREDLFIERFLGYVDIALDGPSSSID